MNTAKKTPGGNRSRVARVNAIPGCALTAALAAIGGRWKLFVVYRLADGPRHFALTSPGRSVLPVAEEIRRWGMAHQAAHASPVQPDGGVDGRVVCDAALTMGSPPQPTRLPR